MRKAGAEPVVFRRFWTTIVGIPFDGADEDVCRPQDSDASGIKGRKTVFPGASDSR